VFRKILIALVVLVVALVAVVAKAIHLLMNRS
jgi:hypothetical protein